MDLWQCPECGVENSKVDKCVNCRCFASKSENVKSKYNDWVCEECQEIN